MKGFFARSGASTWWTFVIFMGLFLFYVAGKGKLVQGEKIGDDM